MSTTEGDYVWNTDSYPPPERVAEILKQAGVYAVPEGEIIPQGISYTARTKPEGTSVRIYFKDGESRYAIGIDRVGRISRLDVLTLEAPSGDTQTPAADRSGRAESLRPGDDPGDHGEPTG